MTQATITFHRIIQDRQDMGTESLAGDHMCSRIEFSLSIGEHQYTDLFVDVKQPFGSNYVEDPLEVGVPSGSYPRKPWNHQGFAAAAEAYYRDALGRLISVGPGSRNIRMQNNAVTMPRTIQIQLPDSTDGGW